MDPLLFVHIKDTFHGKELVYHARCFLNEFITSNLVCKFTEDRILKVLNDTIKDIRLVFEHELDTLILDLGILRLLQILLQLLHRDTQTQYEGDSLVKVSIRYANELLLLRLDHTRKDSRLLIVVSLAMEASQ